MKEKVEEREDVVMLEKRSNDVSPDRGEDETESLCQCSPGPADSSLKKLQSNDTRGSKVAGTTMC